MYRTDWQTLGDRVQGRWLLPPHPGRPGRVVDDSRQIRSGDLFVAIAGELADGFDYLAQAMAGGAAAVCCDRRPADGLLAAMRERRTGLLIVDEGLAAFHALARAHRSALRAIPVIAVTGSSGKTSMRCMIQAILEEAFPGAVVGTEGNTNNHFGVPRNLFRLRPRHKAAVFELGTSHPGEIASLAEIVQPDVAVVGNVGSAHIEFFGTREAIAREKGSLFLSLPATGTAVYPAVSRARDILRRLAGDRPALRFGPMGGEGEVLYRYDGLHGATSQSTLLWQAEGESHHLAWPLAGAHQAANAAAAAAACTALGIDRSTILRGLRKTVLLDMRTSVVRHGGVLWYNDAYNSNPESARAALDWFAEATASGVGNRYMVLGDMLELGAKHAQVEHVGLLREALAGHPQATLVGVGREMAAAGKACGVRTFETARLAGEWLASRLKAGDHVLLKGSRGIRLESIVDLWRRADGCHQSGATPQTERTTR